MVDNRTRGRYGRGMANIGTEKRVYEIPEPASIPDTVPESIPAGPPVREPEKVPVPA